MSKVTKATSMFTKLCWVSTFETPREPHFALVSTVFGGIRPKIQPEAKDSSMVVVDGARPVSMVAWKQAAVETSRAAQAMAAMVRMEPSLGRGERRQYARVSETLQMPRRARPSGRVSRRGGLPEGRKCVGELDPDHR